MSILLTQDDAEIQIYVPENQQASGGDATVPEVTPAETNQNEDRMPDVKTTDDVATNENESFSLDVQIEAELKPGELSEVVDTVPSEIACPQSAEDVESTSQQSSNGVEFCLAPEFHEFEDASDKGESSVVVCSIVEFESSHTSSREV